MIDEPRVRDWMIRDVVGQSPASAGERLAVLDRFLRVLAEAGQIEAHPLAGYRTGHHLRSWQRLVRALQAVDPHAALADLYPPPEPAGPLATLVRSYVDLQRALGKGIERPQATLKDLDQFLRAHAVDSPQAATPALLEDWMDTRVGCDLWRCAADPPCPSLFRSPACPGRRGAQSRRGAAERPQAAPALLVPAVPLQR